jgi:hypothetical protein
MHLDQQTNKVVPSRVKNYQSTMVEDHPFVVRERIHMSKGGQVPKPWWWGLPLLLFI